MTGPASGDGVDCKGHIDAWFSERVAPTTAMASSALVSDIQEGDAGGSVQIQ
jgi:hypothetical protein